MMEFNEVINKRKTSREFTDKEVDFEAIKRILEAGMKAKSVLIWALVTGNVLQKQ